jgi:hypothetical protein
MGFDYYFGAERLGIFGSFGPAIRCNLFMNFDKVHKKISTSIGAKRKHFAFFAII